MKSPIESFTEFMIAKYPDICPVCLGQKKLQFVGPATRQLCVVTCHECNGTGEKPAPRASVMPPHMASIVWPEPDEKAIKEKEEG